MKECKFCGKKYEPATHHSVYCAECRNTYNTEILNGTTFDPRKEQTCERCGIKYIRNHKSKYCSSECTVSAQSDKRKQLQLNAIKVEKAEYTLSCEVCGKEFKSLKIPAKYCSDECKRLKSNQRKLSGQKHLTYTCLQCGKTYHPKEANRDKYCSRECCFKYMNEHHVVKPIDPNPICVVCGKEFERGTHGFTYCSDDCRATFEADRYKQYKVSEKYKEKLKAKVEKLALMPKIEHECIECGNTFYSNHWKVSCCSDECSRKRSNRNKYEKDIKRFKGSAIIDRDITLDKLIKRDKNECYICGKVCNKKDIRIDTKGNFIVGQSYPSIDHVIPASKGGTHTWDNIKLAHFRCNAIKSDKETIIKSNGQVSMAI